VGKFLGIDYGKKRIGLSITDDNKIISSPLDTVSTVDIFNFLDNFLQKEDIELIVIGMPKRLDNTDNLISKEIHIFSKKITKKFQIPIRFVDERYTSKIASTIIINSHLKKMKRRDKTIVDKVSASLILETYLSLIKNN
tara:strand:+ start:106 stop:522 length:417 start_codon:yes stop_codon:yes gene_type:complete